MMFNVFVKKIEEFFTSVLAFFYEGAISQTYPLIIFVNIQ